MCGLQNHMRAGCTNQVFILIICLIYCIIITATCQSFIFLNRSSSSVHHYIFDFVLKIGQKCERMESLLVDMASLRILLSLASPDQEKFSSFLNSVVSEVVQHRDQCFQDVVCTLLVSV